MPKSEDLVMFAIVAAAAATGVFLYAWTVNNVSDRVPALVRSDGSVQSAAHRRS